jgi:hypothetical protein
LPTPSASPTPETDRDGCSSSIRIWNGSALLSTPFLNLGSTGANRVLCGGERGLLGLAFHPDYESNGLFYVYYTRRDDPATTANNEAGDIVLARYQVSTNPNVASSSETPLLTIDHPNDNSISPPATVGAAAIQARTART